MSGRCEEIVENRENLALSETLYLLETFTLVKNGLPENLFCGNIKAITANYDKRPIRNKQGIDI